MVLLTVVHALRANDLTSNSRHILYTQVYADEQSYRQKVTNVTEQQLNTRAHSSWYLIVQCTYIVYTVSETLGRQCVYVHVHVLYMYVYIHAHMYMLYCIGAVHLTDCTISQLENEITRRQEVTFTIHVHVQLPYSYIHASTFTMHRALLSPSS